ncbi:MAG TPA: replication protein RepA, partial [Chloroflexota bacterium]|nr:replication protein RepA [Chloroflexota bacterium]
IPRLLLFWITTEAVRVRDRRLELGHSLNGFIAELGLNPQTGGGKRGDARRLRDQMERLFRSRFTLERYEAHAGQAGKGWIDMQVAPKGQLWWSEKQPDQGALWGSWIELGEDFYRAITAAPVPLDMRALRALKRSPLALDLYAWLTYEAFRAQHSRRSRFETWTQLHGHMGGEYSDVDNFRKKAKAALKKIRAVYPGLKLGQRQGGIEVLAQSRSAIPPGITIDGTEKPVDK